jgi:hypothetical protein
MTRLEIKVEAEVNNTESPEKVEAAIVNVLGGIELKPIKRGDRTTLEGRLFDVESLKRLRDLLSKDRIRDAARSFLSRRVEGDVLSFGLSRLAAYAKHVSFYRSREAPLGPIQITIKGDVSEAIEYLCGK